MRPAKEILALANIKKGQEIFWLETALANEFRKLCGSRRASMVVETLIREFVADAKKKK